MIHPKPCSFCGNDPVLVHLEKSLSIRCLAPECPAKPLVDNFMESQRHDIITIWNELNQNSEHNDQQAKKPNWIQQKPIWCGEIA